MVPSLFLSLAHTHTTITIATHLCGRRWPGEGAIDSATRVHKPILMTILPDVQFSLLLPHHDHHHDSTEDRAGRP